MKKKIIIFTINDANNPYGFAISELLPVSGFEWMKDLSIIDEDFIKTMMKIAIKDTYLK